MRSEDPNLWITSGDGSDGRMPRTRGFLRDSTTDKRVVPYSRLLSTELSTVSTAVNTVKELTRLRRDPITGRWGEPPRTTDSRRRRDPKVSGASMGSPAVGPPRSSTDDTVLDRRQGSTREVSGQPRCLQRGSVVRRQAAAAAQPAADPRRSAD